MPPKVKLNLKDGIIEVDGVKYLREDLIPKDQNGEELTIHHVQPNYYQNTSFLRVSFRVMPKTKLRPGMKIKVSIVKPSE